MLDPSPSWTGKLIPLVNPLSPLSLSLIFYFQHWVPLPIGAAQVIDRFTFLLYVLFLLFVSL